MIEFKVEWQDSEGVRSPELAATWGRLEILIAGPGVQDGNLCNVVTKAGTRTGVYVSLYPLAEWIATHWHVLLNEVASIEKENDSAFLSRHDILCASEGFALPHLKFISQGDLVLCEWKQTDWPNAGLRFLNQGRTHLSKRAVEESFNSLVSNVLCRLKEKLPSYRTFLEDEWDGITSLTKRESDFCKVLGQLGIDPFSVSAEREAEVTSVHSKIPEDLRDEFFCATSTEALSSDATWVKDCLSFEKRMIDVSDQIREIRSKVIEWNDVQHTELPWIRGYQLARRVRNYLGNEDEPLNGEVIDLHAINLHLNPSPTSFDGLVFPNDGRILVPAEKTAKSRRFDFARSLFCLLFSRQRHSLVSKAQTNYQQMTRAFAAELLAPSKGLTRQISHSRAIDDEKLDRLAEHFNVSQKVIEHQIENHRLAALSNSSI